MRIWKNQRHFISITALAEITQAFQTEATDEDYNEQLALDELTTDTLNNCVAELGEQRLLHAAITEVLSTLPGRSAGVIALRFGLTDDRPETLLDIGKVYGVTRERVRQVESKTMAMLRHPARSLILAQFLGGSAFAPEAIQRGATISPPMETIPSLIPRRRYDSETRNIAYDAYIHPETQLREAWQIDPMEEWDAPVRMSAEEINNLYERAGQRFMHIMLQAESRHFTREQAAIEDGSLFPGELLTAINDACGQYLVGHHIETFWNQHTKTMSDRLQKQAGDDFVMDRLSLLFSHIIAERITDNDVLHLHIPDNLADQLDMFGTNLQYGELVIHGNLGNFVGYQMGGIANITVIGDVGDYAASDMSGLASLHVTGEAGADLAYGATDGTIVVKGYVESLALRPTFKGEITAGAVGNINVGAPIDTYTIVSKRRTGRPDVSE